MYFSLAHMGLEVAIDIRLTFKGVVWEAALNRKL